MAGKSAKLVKNRAVAELVTENRQPCIFCHHDVDDEVIYGKLYALGDIQCHYFCVLLSCCLVQKGRDTEGLFGFLYKDIIAEVERSKKHKCSYCGRVGASIGCCVATCRKQFHLPCGRQKNAISLFYGNYKSFCELHAPKQKISDDVMANAKLRLKRERVLKSKRKTKQNEEIQQIDEQAEAATVCVICYEEVQGWPTTQTFWPPCCGRDAWLHRTCLQRMALSAGMHYVKCPLCNDKQHFYEAVCEQGYYLPDRDAAWELEQNAFAEIYERPESCGAVECKCPFGRAHDEPGIWDIKLCMLCGSCGAHAHCLGAERMLCAACRPAANDIEQLETRLASVIRAEQEREARSVRSGPVMPSRMSLRRTKGRRPAHSGPSSSQNVPNNEPRMEFKTERVTPEKESIDRQDLNLKPPKRPNFLEPNVLKDLENKLLSPVKMLEQRYLEKLGGMEDLVVNSSEVMAKMRARFTKPKPLSEKQRIVNEILDDLFQNVFKENMENKDRAKQWSSPKKCFKIAEENNQETKENLPEIVSENDKPDDQTKEIKEDSEQIETDDSQIRKIDEVTEDNVDANKHIENQRDETDNEEKGELNDLTVDEITKRDDESSNTTFKLAPEFITQGEDSFPIFDTPKKQKTVVIEQNSSLEISENDEVVNIDVVTIGEGNGNDLIDNLSGNSTVENKRCSFKLSAVDKETLQNDNVDIDIDTFKDQYLNEVDRDFVCNFNHNHVNHDSDKVKLSSVIDFAVDATMNRKREHETKVGGKGIKKLKLKVKSVSKDKKKVKKMKKEHRDKHIRMKIKWKDETKVKSKKLKKKQKTKKFKQYVLKYSPIQLNKGIAKPENEVLPLKRKHVKLEKSPDKLVQTSIQSFFKVK